MNKKQSSKMQLGKYVFIIPIVIAGSLIFGVSKAYDKAEAPLMAATQDSLRANAPIYVVDGNFISDKEASKLDSITIESIEVITDAAAHNIYGTKAQNGIIKITTKKKNAEDIRSSALQDTLKTNDPLYVVDGKKQNSMDKINTETIESVSVLKGKAATDLYGEEGKNGVVLVTTKKANQDPVVEKVAPPANKISVKVSTDSLQLTANLENYKEDKEPVVIGIKNNKITSLEGADENVLIYVDGKKSTRNDLSRLDPDNFESINVFKGKSAIERYGEEGKDGVIEFTTKGKN